MPNRHASFRYRSGIVGVLRVRYDSTLVDATPGTVLKTGPPLLVATGLGTVTITEAFTRGLMRQRWPGRRAAPKPGESLG